MPSSVESVESASSSRPQHALLFNSGFEGRQFPHCTVALAFATLVVTFIVFMAGTGQSHLKGDASVKIPGVSISGGWLPGSIIFTAGLHLVAVLLFATAWVVDAALRQSLTVAATRLRSQAAATSAVIAIVTSAANGAASAPRKPSPGAAGASLARAQGLSTSFQPRLPDAIDLATGSITSAWLVGVFMSACLYALASVPCTFWGNLHNAFAILFFFSALLYMHLVTNRVLRRAAAALVVTPADRHWLRHKRVTLWASGFFLLLYLIVFPAIESMDPSGVDCDPFTGDPWCPLESVRSVVEYLSAASLFAWVWSLTHDTRHVAVGLLPSSRDAAETEVESAGGYGTASSSPSASPVAGSISAAAAAGPGGKAKPASGNPMHNGGVGVPSELEAAMVGAASK